MNEFSGISVTVLQGWLSSAQSALQSLAIGQQVVRLQTGDKSLSFTPADSDKLRRYILRLQNAIAIAQGTSSGQPYSVATWTR